mmetsp:Transcript_19514/g.55111  ORF Transcript_19514/g.55111 Transcript_19514/m.55111 type:complete len:283 (+) Transcript_19514:663-1511(+)
MTIPSSSRLRKSNPRPRKSTWHRRRNATMQRLSHQKRMASMMRRLRWTKRRKLNPPKSKRELTMRTKRLTQIRWQRRRQTLLASRKLILDQSRRRKIQRPQNQWTKPRLLLLPAPPPQPPPPLLSPPTLPTMRTTAETQNRKIPLQMKRRRMRRRHRRKKQNPHLRPHKQPREIVRMEQSTRMSRVQAGTTTTHAAMPTKKGVRMKRTALRKEKLSQSNKKRRKLANAKIKMVRSGHPAVVLKREQGRRDPTHPRTKEDLETMYRTKGPNQKSETNLSEINQ